MNSTLRYILAMSCVLPALVGCCMYRKMQPPYRLLILILLMDAVTETIDFIGHKVASFKQAANFWSDAYIIISLVMFLQFVRHTGYIKKQLQQFFIAVAALLGICVILKLSPIFRSTYILLCFMYAAKLYISIDILSRQVTAVNTMLNYNFWFWASALFVVQSAYGLLAFGIYLFSLENTAYGENIGYLHLYVNVIYYCLFAVVLLRVPKKTRGFIHQLS